MYSSQRVVHVANNNEKKKGVLGKQKRNDESTNLSSSRMDILSSHSIIMTLSRQKGPLFYIKVFLPTLSYSFMLFPLFFHCQLRSPTNLPATTSDSKLFGFQRWRASITWLTRGTRRSLMSTRWRSSGRVPATPSTSPIAWLVSSLAIR